MPATVFESSALSDLFCQVISTGKLTLADQQGLEAALSEGSLPEEDSQTIHRLLWAAARGRVQLVNEPSHMQQFN